MRERGKEKERKGRKETKMTEENTAEINFWLRPSLFDNYENERGTFMSDAMVSGMFLRFLLRQSAVLSPNIVATEQ